MDNKNISVYDNYLDPRDFKKIQSVMMDDPDFPWNWCEHTVRNQFQNDGTLLENNYQYVHIFMNKITLFENRLSKYITILQPLIELIGAVAWIRIKANANPRTEKIVISGFHQDVTERRLLECEPTTAIFYLNTNDGYTIFEEDGTKVNSVANRICFFPHWMYHSCTTCTNANRRIALNLNFVR